MNTIIDNNATKIPAISIEVTMNDEVIATFSNGKRLIVDAAHLSDDIRRQAMLHGIKQKIGDAAAIARNTTTGASASIQDKFDAMAEVVERLTAADGAWNKTREGGAGAGNTL